jgi:DNA-binding IclR family transcriptional regulator
MPDVKPNTKPQSAYRVQVLDRTFAILSVLAESNQLLGPTEIGSRLHLNKSTVHRLLAVLEQHRCVERDAATARYRIGLRMAELGSFASPRFDFEKSAKPFVEKLAAETGEAAHVGILCAGEVLSILHSPGPYSADSPSTVGRRSPVHCTSLGKAILAFHQESEELIQSLRYVTYTKRTIRNYAQFNAELLRVRSRGLAIDDEEFQEGLRCIGAPVFDGTGRAIAAISIAGPRSRITRDRSGNLARSVLTVARALGENVARVSGKAAVWPPAWPV